MLPLISLPVVFPSVGGLGHRYDDTAGDPGRKPVRQGGGDPKGPRRLVEEYVLHDFPKKPCMGWMG